MNLLERSFTLITPDFPGFGSTPPPPAAWSVHDYTRWLLSVFDHLEIESPHIIGHSFGGRIAISLASQWPHRVSKVVLTSSAGIRPSRTFRHHVQVRLFKALRQLTYMRGVPPTLRKWAAVQAEHRGSSDYQQASGTVRESFVHVVNEDLRPLLAHIKAPTLLIWGDQDKDTPLTDAYIMEQQISDAGLVIFEGAGHYAYLEQAARFSKIVETFFVAESMNLIINSGIIQIGVVIWGLWLVRVLGS